MKIRLEDEKDGQPFEPSEWYIDGGDMSATYQPKNIVEFLTGRTREQQNSIP